MLVVKLWKIRLHQAIQAKGSKDSQLSVLILNKTKTFSKAKGHLKIQGIEKKSIQT